MSNYTGRLKQAQVLLHACDPLQFTFRTVTDLIAAIRDLEHLLEIEREAAVMSFDDKKHILEQLAQMTTHYQVAVDTVERQRHDNEKLTGYIHAIDGAKDKKIAELKATIDEMRKLPVASPWYQSIRVCKIHNVPDCSVFCVLCHC
jgi:hypothetical protein